MLFLSDRNFGGTWWHENEYRFIVPSISNVLVKEIAGSGDESKRRIATLSDETTHWPACSILVVPTSCTLVQLSYKVLQLLIL